MSEPGRKRRGPITLLCESRRFRWAAVAAVVVVPILYVVGVGPACWIIERTGHEGPVYEALAWFYGPLETAYDYAPEPVQQVMDSWCDLWDQ